MSGETTQFEYRPNKAPVPAAERDALVADPGFGRIFTDHMAVIRYSEGKGWHDARIEPRGPLQVDPASAMLHYAQEIFEGMKAYRFQNGAGLFRPDANARRFNSSASRMSMPELPEALFLGSVRRLVDVDRGWIPSQPGSSLYLRPFMIGTEVFLGVKPSAEYLFMVIATPVGSYFKSTTETISVWISQDTRAASGGTGAAKCGGNYAASLRAQAEAVRNSCDQTLFLDASERRWVEELGGMNIFFVFDDGSLLTPPLEGTILPGITRDSLITLARGQGLTVREAPYSIDAWRKDAASGRLAEAFACGTAAVVAAIGKVASREGSFTIGNPELSGPITKQLRAVLVDIQLGNAADPYGWVERVL